jgi:hypothetical protein
VNGQMRLLRNTMPHFQKSYEQQASHYSLCCSSKVEILSLKGLQISALHRSTDHEHSG